MLKEWKGQLESGDYLPRGEYKFAVRALIFGDPNVESDWNTAETPKQPAGEKACKIYQVGKSDLPEAPCSRP